MGKRVRVAAIGAGLALTFIGVEVVDGRMLGGSDGSGSGRSLSAEGPRPTIGLSFEPNVGQSPEGISFIAQTSGSWFGFAPGSVRLGSGTPDGPAPRLVFPGSQSGASPVATTRLPGVTNYLLGDDPDGWLVNVPRYAAVTYGTLYPGIDLTFYGAPTGQLEFDVIVEPNADPERFRVAAADDTLLRGIDGGLRLASRPDVRLSRPVAYQVIDGVRHAVEAAFVLDDGTAGFDLGPFDHRVALVIDPVLEYATYLGGSGSEDVIYTAPGSDGSFYLAGVTDSIDFPVSDGTLSEDLAGQADVFVTKLNASGTEVVYSTYLGGPKVDVAIGIDVDADGAAYVVGYTASHRFPTTPGAAQRRFGGGPGDAFVTKLDPDGSGIAYSSFLGGSGDDVAFIAPVDEEGSLYVEGWTGSEDFPISDGAFQDAYGGGPYDAFSTRLDATGSTMLYSTYLGGSGDDGGWDAELDADGRIHLTGGTDSRDFPVTPGAFQARYGGGRTDAFVLVLNQTGTDLVSSTYVGGKRYEEVTDLTVDAAGNSYVPGTTTSKDFPTTAEALQSDSGGGKHDGYLVRLSPDGTDLSYGTYIGGEGDDVAGAVRISGAGVAVISGVTNSADFPVTPDALQGTFGGGPDDAFAMWLDLATSTIEYSTYLGGRRSDGSSGAGLALDASGVVTIPGYTTSKDFPTTPGVVQRAFAGASDVFIVRFEP